MRWGSLIESVISEWLMTTQEHSLPRELSVLDPLGLHDVQPEPRDFVLLAGFEVTLEPFELTVALSRSHART